MLLNHKVLEVKSQQGSLWILILHFSLQRSLIEHLSSLLKWRRSNSKTSQSDENVLQFENGYVVETVVEGNDIGVVPHRILVSAEDGEIFAVDAINSNIVRITPPLSQYSRGRLVAGSFQGYTGHVDGKPSDSRFNHPKGITVDDKGNVYVADTQNLAIRKIGDAGVTTIAGGKSNVAGYRDGPSEDAKFSNDFDVVYVRPTCSLLVIDRGNAALRQINLNQEDCDYQSSSISVTDVLTVVGAVLVGYATCRFQQGFGSSFFPKTPSSKGEFKGQDHKGETKWPSFRQLLVYLSNFSLKTFSSFFRFIPWRSKSDSTKRGLTPQNDLLKMPEDEVEEVPMADRQRAFDSLLTETKQVHTPSTAEKYSQMRPAKIKSSSSKDPSLLRKHHSLKKQEYAEFYGSTEVPSHAKSKSQKQRSKHRKREKVGHVLSEGVGAEKKPVEMRGVDYGNPRFEHYNTRTKYVPEDSFLFNPH
ncbi:Six-bladed beta-propeller [Vigna unguiculata]|uniref:Six-bladed beta-propeller n=1 Tax=Vigna unguiculata TaxID=3917 RepID=A0A4D6LFR2_VIGUN|nr:Six-bladed beta-propeller [Vigna unguiculata]